LREKGREPYGGKASLLHIGSEGIEPQGRLASPVEEKQPAHLSDPRGKARKSSGAEEKKHAELSDLPEKRDAADMRQASYEKREGTAPAPAHGARKKNEGSL